MDKRDETVVCKQLVDVLVCDVDVDVDVDVVVAVVDLLTRDLFPPFFSETRLLTSWIMPEGQARTDPGG